MIDNSIIESGGNLNLNLWQLINKCIYWYIVLLPYNQCNCADYKIINVIDSICTCWLILIRNHQCMIMNHLILNLNIAHILTTSFVKGKWTWQPFYKYITNMSYCSSCLQLVSKSTVRNFKHQIVTQQDVLYIQRCENNKHYIFINVEDSDAFLCLNSKNANHKFRCFKICTFAIFVVRTRFRKYICGPFWHEVSHVYF